MALTQGRDVRVLDTLAAAYAEKGQYRKAVETGEEALVMANRLRNYDLVADIEERLRLYQWGCPYYEDPKVQLDRLLAKTKSDDRGRMTPDREPPTDDWQLDTKNSTQEVQDANETTSTE
jgi:hypothetical protein